MSELQPINELRLARQDSSAAWAQDLHTVYYRPTAAEAAQGDPQKHAEQVKPGDGKTPAQPADKTVTLKTGDVLTMAPDGQVLQTPNGEKLVLEREFDGATLSTAWVMADKKGNEISHQYSHTICTMPEITVSKMSNGARLEERGGVSTISYPNGDHIQLDVWGVTEIKRGKVTEHIRQPITQPLELPADPNRKYKT